jgi:hypothetical protein
VQAVREVLASITSQDVRGMWAWSMRKYIRTLTYGFD